ncbi:hypothetical protein [Fenollaria massiliensis]|uniref:Uncharacterized protein n=1 Tax=Fenollaria massiliensis TaxID=938288 RepID=A0A9E7IUM1_9FIRM|nr:hypothetical protein [Fenollaria massiliensis]UQK59047.1 hypothetical protein M1R53_07345 [Fenollaria massiliensis]
MDKTRKRILAIVGILILVLILAFFTNKKVVYRYLPNSAVNETVKKMKESSKAKNADNADANTENDDADENIDPEENANSDENIDTNENSDENINPDTNDGAEKNEITNESGQYYDLTGNDLDMNYVIVAMIAEDPKSFEGVKIKLQGVAVDLETTDTSGMDHYIVINDRQACCQQGLQYILKDKNQKYPKPQEIITVEGELTVFNSEEIPFPLAVIKNAKLISN